MLYDGVPPKIHQDLLDVRSEAGRITGIVKRLRLFARRQIEKGDVNINGCVKEAMQLRAYNLSVNNISVHTMLAPDLPEISGSSNMLRQVFGTISLNAEQVIPEGSSGGKLTVKTELIENRVIVSITRDGSAIKMETKKQSDSTSGAVSGPPVSGLGMSTCQVIIAEHGGRITTASDSSKNITYIIELPVTREESRRII